MTHKKIPYLRRARRTLLSQDMGKKERRKSIYSTCKENYKKRKKVLAFCKKVLYTNEVGCGKQQKSRANDTNEYGQLVKGLRRRPLTAETRVRFPYWLSAESS